ncbi:hypothetical protein BOTCAL_0277g00110 [Botryotinia calthae]|uniref:Rxt3-domain-containing protein n=1 Tax=Botryotinia calthae TaxID=38488 RepID=A0A4Y8CXS9_9HELO|nr:hypothetical protein BOTCAL_0277g00110 [Botryotinia calthae]
MEGRPPQLPFSRNTNTASPYGRSSFPPAPNGQPSQYPPSSHPPSGPPSYPDHQRRTSDGQYFQPRYQEGPPLHGGGHSRNPNSSSIGHSTPVGRGMPPPSSPQQQQQPQQHQGPIQHSYGPPHPRGPPVSVGPPVGFPSSRELPPPLNRPPSTAGSNMSISSLLGGPAPTTREQMPNQYTSPITTSAPPPMYGSATHASPRVSSAANDYTSFGRPRTPDSRYEHRDHRANSAGSPPGAGQYGTPDHRHATPQHYGHRPSQNQIAQHPDDRRDSQGMRSSNMNMPPRPNSQPMTYHSSTSRPGDRSTLHGESQLGGRRMEQDSRGMETLTRGDPIHQRPSGFSSRHDPVFEHIDREREKERERERDRAERESAAATAMMLNHRERERERERSASDREQAMAMKEQARPGIHGEYPHQMSQRNHPQVYGRQPDAREQAAWVRPGHEQQRPGFEQPPYERPPPSYAPHGNVYDQPRSAAPQYGIHPAYQPVPNHDQRDPRYTHVSHYPPHSQQQQAPGPGPHFEQTFDDRMLQQQQQEHQAAARQRAEVKAQQSAFAGSMPPNPQYTQHDSPQRRVIEEAPPQMMQQHQSQRGLLSVQDNRRGGRVSPIPQAVQGAQSQQPGPAGEPSIKSEFGKIFPGIGSGVALSLSSPVAGSTTGGLPFSGSRREDLDSPSAHNSPIENGSSAMPRPFGRRRKLKEEDRNDDDSSTGRQTPNGRGKRTKHAAHRHIHQHRVAGALDHIPSPSSQSMTPFKSVKKINGDVSPPHGEISVVPHHHLTNSHSHHHHHHHHHSTGPIHNSVGPRVPPLNNHLHMPKYRVHSQEIIDDASQHPRCHLGSEYYQANLSLYRSNSTGELPYNRAFAGTNKSSANFENLINCTFTIKISRVHLQPPSRAQITARKNLWGTDVYSDDSDIIAALIHQGWICGKWSDDIDVKLLDLYQADEGISVEPELDTMADGPDELFEHPPARGPMPVRNNRDLHVTVLVLGCLDKYFSTIRYGIKSREWGGKNTRAHDGLSYLIMNIRWVEGVNGMERGNVAMKHHMDREYQEVDRDRELWLETAMNGNGKRTMDHDNGEDIVMEESNMRGDGHAQHVLNDGEIRGVGMRSWWKGNSRGSSKRINTGEDSAPQRGVELLGVEISPRPAYSPPARGDITRANALGNGDTTKHSTNSAPISDNRDNANPTLEWGRVQVPSVNPGAPLKRENNLPVSSSNPEPMAVKETAPPPKTSMPTETPESGNLALKTTEDPSREEEIVKDIESTQNPKQAISQPEIQPNQPSQTPVPESKKSDEDISTTAESKDLSTTAQVVPVVEVPAAAIETQTQAQSIQAGGDFSAEVGADADAVVDADSSSSAPANN